MKKIYMILAVFALLSLSLNAQTRAGHAPMRVAVTNTYTYTLPNSNAFSTNGGTAALGDFNWTYSSFTYKGWEDTRGLQIGSRNNPTSTFTLSTSEIPGTITSITVGANAYSNRATIGVTVGGAAFGTTQNLSSGTSAATNTFTGSASGNIVITWNNASTGGRALYFKSITVTYEVDVPIHDLGIALSAPTSVVAGNTATVTATVTNNGDYTESNYTVTIYANGTAISTQTGGSLAPGATATFTADYATTDAQAGSTVNFTATVACTGDEDTTNDNAAASTPVITLLPPINVVATPDNNNMTATVTWDAPIIDPVIETITEDFEDTSVFPTFTTGGVNANTHTGAFGSWTLYDGNGVNVYGMSDVDFGTDVEQTPYAWMPFDLTATTPVWTVTNISAHSGTQFMNSVSVPSATTNHWLISPELSGNAQTISWYDAEMKTNWGAESYEVLYSTTDNNYTSFTSLGTYSADALTWGTAETANLPAGAKYFAIRHTQNDGFGLMIDDVTYEGLVPGLQPVSYNVYLNGVLQGSVNANDPLTYDFNNLSGGNYTVEISAVYPGNIESAKVSAQFTLTPKTATPTITSVVNGDNVVITATGDGTVTLTVDGQTVSGNGSASITVPRTNATFSVTATATAQESGKLESDPATETITIPFLQTATPNITYVANDDNDNVVITATGDGTVTLTVGGQTVSGQGSASITIPYGMTSNTVTATATAQHSGWAVSETATQQITIPAATGWQQMDGTYDNPNTLLSFTVNGEEIMLIDQFLASTLKNDHPDGYTYTLREIVNREEKSSSPVNIPVYKTSSKMNGFYTKGQVDTADLKMGLKAQVINSEMCNDVNPDRNALYHSLYRSDKNGDYPVIDVQHRVSQLQKYEENENNTVQYYFTETHTSGITPRYDHIGRQNVERLDTNYVQGVFEDSLAYVPVIWTFGLYSGREDGKNNSYGSDIKREYLGGVSATIEGSMSNERPYGTWTANGVEYCVYTPVITIEGTPPAIKVDNDGDVSTYEPYMYRAWCLYEGAHDFKRVNGSLADNGELQAPIPLGTVQTDQAHAIIGGDWTTTSGHLPWAFGIPVSECDHPENVTFAIRFYYKKTVTEAGQEPNGLRDGEEQQEYYIVECEGDAHGISTAINELFNGRVPVETIYYNSVGMQSNEPFDGINIVVTRYSDGTSTTTKVMR